MQPAASFRSPNLNWNQDDFDNASKQDISSFYPRNDWSPGYCGVLQARNSTLASSPDMVSRDTSNLPRALRREFEVHAVKPPPGQVDLTYGRQLPEYSPKPQEARIMNQSSNSFSSSAEVDSLSNSFLQLDLLGNVRKQLHLQGERIFISEQQKCLQQQALPKEPLRHSNEELYLPEDLLRMPGGIETDEWHDFRDLQALQQQVVIKELELRYYKQRVCQLRCWVKELLEEKLSLEKQIEQMHLHIVSKQATSYCPHQMLLCRNSTSFISPAPTPNLLDVGGSWKLALHRACDRDFSQTKSQVDLELQDLICHDMYYAKSTSSGWQSTDGYWSQHSCPNSGIPGSQEMFLIGNTDIGFQHSNLQASVPDPKSTRNQKFLPSSAYVNLGNLNLAHSPVYEAKGDHYQSLSAAAQDFEEAQVKKNSQSDLCKSERGQQVKHVANLPMYLKGKSIISEGNKNAFYDSRDISSPSTGSIQDWSPAGSLSPLRHQRQYGGDAKDLKMLSPTGISHQGQIKTELCKNWQECGSCPYSLHCRFAHGVGELRPVLRHPLYKTQICRMLLEGKKCIYDHRCHFRHSLTDEEISLIARMREC